ncbi:hypothetical protein E1B28_004885 [Marasmius oreades]|uniref:RNA helicase n=1 Tax=Marasmius oreades TaxID=181124 RepID=A0A9P7UZL7_9AGAR|nr:uncharacterized protein E1B28_004885 [Marasmius oreades]KAG7097547.1 hypothetical protein E1B28_004885 [Marasmius oreades]
MASSLLMDPKATFQTTFSHLLDPRILSALADMRMSRPTLVQTKVISIALSEESRDILARARTGSGKTAAFGVPIVQRILKVKESSDTSLNDPSRQVTRALILVPTRELAEQISVFFRGVTKYCQDVVVHNVASSSMGSLQRTLAVEKPDIVVSTPSRALALIQSKSLVLTSLESLVIDEADLILSYGHDEDVRQIFSGAYLPKIYQSYLMSATMTEDVELLKGLTLRNPALLKLEEDEDDAARLTQYAVRCSETDKFLLTYVMLKLKLIKGKTILFVNSVERCYRLKLFLEQFSIKSCVLNSELPLNSRYHTVQEFNKGVYEYIIATDESGGVGLGGGDERDEGDDEDEAEGHEEFTSTQREPENTNVDEGEEATITRKRKRMADTTTSQTEQKTRKRRHKKGRGDKEYGVTRGVDFIDVSCVLNFDLPSSSRSYTHRVGRTARAGRTGMSLSFVVPNEEWGKNKIVGCLPSAKDDEKVFEKIEGEQAGRGSKMKEYKFDMKQVEAFRYRMEDALRSVTRNAIREARIKEVKTEILNSDKLQVRFYCDLKSESTNSSRHTLKIIHSTSNTCDTINLYIQRGYNLI